MNPNLIKRWLSVGRSFWQPSLPDTELDIDKGVQLQAKVSDWSVLDPSPYVTRVSWTTIHTQSTNHQIVNFFSRNRNYLLERISITRNEINNLALRRWGFFVDNFDGGDTYIDWFGRETRHSELNQGFDYEIQSFTSVNPGLLHIHSAFPPETPVYEFLPTRPRVWGRAGDGIHLAVETLMDRADVAITYRIGIDAIVLREDVGRDLALDAYR